MSEIKKIFSQATRDFHQVREVVRQAVNSALIELAYIVVVAFFFAASGVVFTASAGGFIFGAMAFLILLVLSVSVSGLLIFGYPIYYLTQKREDKAIISLGVILGTLAIAFVFLFFLALIF